MEKDTKKEKNQSAVATIKPSWVLEAISFLFWIIYLNNAC